MTETYELTRKIYIQAQPETIFSYLTIEAKMKEWFGEVVEADAKPGGIFRVGNSNGTCNCTGQYVELVPHSKVVFTWGGVEDLEPGDSTVEISLRPEGDGTHLTLRHYNIRLKPAADSFGQGWKEHAFPLLQSICEGRIPDGLCFESELRCCKD
ncbi:MAG: SRPBCC domain-containing protein [Nitrospina sp.]|jgi:uncharacterized protein YndB with AHSA1/START domain|nr:SRPBCC domain-containing protein [Nitrospina sp.]MBT7710088.1 SRPBCC domain-containing protein [Nitrospina sp.]